MAIIDTDKTYVRILYDECYVKGNDVRVVIRTYKSKEERDKEKSRQSKIEEFINTLREKYGIYNLQAQEARLENDVHTYELQTAAFNQHYNQEVSLLANYIKYLNTPNEVSFRKYLSDEELETYGFNQEWVDDPVICYSDTEVSVGLYRGETISHEFYYNRLKEFMSDAVIDD